MAVRPYIFVAWGGDGGGAVGFCEDVLAVLGVGLMLLVVDEIAGFSFVALVGGMVLRDEGGSLLCSE